MLHDEKREIRKKILALLKIQKEEYKLKKSEVIKLKLFSCSWFKQARTVMFYVSWDSEVNTLGMIKEAKLQGKSVVVPRLIPGERIMVPCVVTNLKKDLEAGPYSIKQPKMHCPIQPSLADIDLVIVPAVAFDRKGNRLGRGKGYYDLFLSGLPEKVHTIGLAFKFQILKRVPITPSDIPVEKVIAA